MLGCIIISGWHWWATLTDQPAWADIVRAFVGFTWQACFVGLALADWARHRRRRGEKPIGRDSLAS